MLTSIFLTFLHFHFIKWVFKQKKRLTLKKWDDKLLRKYNRKTKKKMD